MKNKIIQFKFNVNLIGIWIAFFLLNTCIVFGQFTIIDGKYSGKMLIYKGMNPVDSVPVVLTIQTLLPDSVWQWKTEYISSKMPVTKDYKMMVSDRKKGVFLTDEGDNTILYNYLFGNKMYCQFETEGFLLTSTYEWINTNEIIFEVTAGKKLNEKNENNLTNYQVNTLQKVIFTRDKL